MGCMHSRRCYLSCGLLSQNSIIAVGGHDGFLRQKTAEIFHISSNQWTLTNDMKRRRFFIHFNCRKFDSSYCLTDLQ